MRTLSLPRLSACPALRPFLLGLLVLGLLALGQSPAQAQGLFQVSTLSALLSGGYDGQVSLAELKQHGDFGLGTFEALDGEMVVLDGVVYQVPVSGAVRVMPDTARTPFACVTFFHPGSQTALGRAASLADLEQRLDQALPSPNLFYALRVDGRFSFLKARSVPRQEKPYPPLAEVVKSQAVFEFKDVQGTLVGLKCPAYAGGLNVPGYHWHFLTADRRAGGHVLDLALEDLSASVAAIREFSMVLPAEGDFLGLDLNRDMSQETRAVEGDRPEEKSQ